MDRRSLSRGKNRRDFRPTSAPGPGESDPPEVLELMHRVTLIPVVRRTLFVPRVTIFSERRSFLVDIRQ